MTTLILQEDAWYSDSQCTAGQTIINSNEQKIFEKGRYVYTSCGAAALLQSIDLLIEGKLEEARDLVGALSGSVVVYDRESKLTYMYSFYENTPEVERKLETLPIVAGSGVDHAWTALDMGATPEEAIKMTAKRDTSTNDLVQKVIL